MKRGFGLYAFCVGLLILVVQFIIILFALVNGDYLNAEPFAVMDASKLNGPNFLDIIKTTWSGIAGTLLLIAMFVRRLVKGTDVAMVVVSIMLWIIQILSLRVKGEGVVELLKSYPLAFVGILIVLIYLVVDIYVIKTHYSGTNESKK